MIRRISRTLFPAWVIFWSAPVLAQSTVPPEVVQGWQAYVERFRFASGSAHSVSKLQEGKETSTQIGRMSFAFGTHGRRLELQVTDNQGRQLLHRLLCENVRYVFQLHAADKGWLLHKVALLGDASQQETIQRIREQLSSGLAGLFTLVAVEGELLTHLADSLQPQGGDKAVLCLVQEHRMTRNRMGWTFRSLTLRLNRDKYYTLHSATAEVQVNKAEGMLSITNEYQDHEGLPVPTRTQRRQVFRSAGWTLESNEEVTYQIDRRTDPPEQEFTLSAFGLPEPVGVEWERKTPVYVWLLLAAGVLGLLAVVLAWLAKRRRTTGES
jgi:hypothetical protein